MKKIIVLAIAMVAIIAGSDAFAQGSRWGVVAGVNYNEIHFKQQDLIPVDRSVGFTAGVTGEYMMPGIGFGVDGSILYTMRSGKLDLGDKKVWSSLGYGEEKFNLNYIDVPLSLKFKYRNMNGFENTLTPLVYAGPVFSFLLNKPYSEMMNYNTLNVGLRLGAGVELLNKVQINACYTFSIGKAMETKLLDENVAKHRTWTMTATYFF